MSTKEYDDAGSTLADPEATEHQLATMKVVPVLSIVPSLTNPRKKFNQAKLDELAESIAASGVMQPVLVRPLPGDRLASTFDFRRAGTPLPIYELVAGERRYRASRQAKVDTIPVMIKSLNDDEVLGIQLAENMLRDDLSPLEEAEGFRNWMEHSKLTSDEVADRVKKSRKHVYNRLKLLQLCPEARTSFEAGTIMLMHALPIATIPDTTLQLKALKYATDKDYNDETPSARKFEQWIKENLMKRLANAPFDTNDNTLHATAGTCQACPKRTGANPDLFAAQGPDFCTDVACFKAKDDTHRNRVIAIAEKKGMRVIEGKEARALIQPHAPIIKGYSRLDTVQHDASTGSSSSLRNLLGKDAPQAVLIEHPTTRELIEVVPTAEADAVLVERGAIKVTKKETNALARIESLKQTLERSLPHVVRTAVQSAISDAIRTTPAPLASALLSPELLRAWLLEEIDNMDSGDIEEALQLAHIEDHMEAGAAHDAAVQAATDDTLYRAVATLMLQSDRYGRHIVGAPGGRCARAIAATLCIDVDAIEKEATVEAKKKLQAAVRAIKAEAATPPTPPAGRGQGGEGQKPKETAEGGKGSGEKTPAPKGRRGKVSAEETMSGIAAAMQGIEASALADAGSPETVQAAAPAEENTLSRTADAAQGNEASALADASTSSAEPWPYPTEPATPPSPSPTSAPTSTAAPDDKFDNSAWPYPKEDPGASDQTALARAKSLVIREQKATVRLLKAEMGIGTRLAMGIMTELEKLRVVSACDERGARKVLVA